MSFFYSSVDLLGHRINRLGLSTQEDKVRAVQKLPYPSIVRKAQEILGIINYYRGFIEKFSWIAAAIYDGMKTTLPAQDLAKMDVKQRAAAHGRQPFPDKPAIRAAFKQLKDVLSSAPVLIHPDFRKPFVLYTDAAKVGIAATLHQIADHDGKEHPVLYISRRLSSPESHDAALELECLWVVRALEKVAHYVYGSNLRLVTDHSALKWLWTVKPTNSRLFKWSILLNPLRDNVEIVHRPGRTHANVDLLSRNPSDQPPPAGKKIIRPAYSTTHVHLTDQWKDNLWMEYIADPAFCSILMDLVDLAENAPSPSPSDDDDAVASRENRRKLGGTWRKMGRTTPSKRREGLPAAEKLLDEYAANQSEEKKATTTDGTLTLVGKVLFFTDKKRTSFENVHSARIGKGSSGNMSRRSMSSGN